MVINIKSMTPMDINTEIQKALKPMKDDIKQLSGQITETRAEVSSVKEVVDKINIALNGDGIYSRGLVKDIKENSNYVQNAQAKGLARRIILVCEHYERWLSEGKWDKLDDVIKEKDANARFKTMTGISNIASAIGFLISLATLFKLFGFI